MLLSMTGFGRAKRSYKDKNILVEVKSLNGKYTDMRFKLPNHYRDHEHLMRRLVSDHALRGRLEVSVELESFADESPATINEGLFKSYYNQLSTLAQDLNAPNPDILHAILRLPNVVVSKGESISKAEWLVVQDAFNEALNKMYEYRLSEGTTLKSVLIEMIAEIKLALSQIPTYEKQRVEKLRNRLHQNIEDSIGKDQIDENRFEQEILYYLEKIDIDEEKVRLASNCDYFLDELNSNKKVKGKKLSFISQEIGREINTLGSKANSADIQKLVVEMKNALEKIKEQLANAV